MNRWTRLRSRAAAAALLGVGGVLAACSDDAGSRASDPAVESPASEAPVARAALDGATYRSTLVEGRELVSGSTIQLAFQDEAMSVSAGCNTMFGPYEVTDGVLAWTTDPASTRMGCEDDLADQDRWLAELLTAGVAATSSGDALRLEADSVTIELERGEA